MSTGEKIVAVFLFAAALWIPFVMMVVEPLLLLYDKIRGRLASRSGSA